MSRAQTSKSTRSKPRGGRSTCPRAAANVCEVGTSCALPEGKSWKMRLDQRLQENDKPGDLGKTTRFTVLFFLSGRIIFSLWKYEVKGDGMHLPSISHDP